MDTDTTVSREHVLGTFREQLEGFEVKGDQVAEDSSFDVLGLDSLDVVELSVRVEDVYGIDIEEDDLENVTTIGNAIDVVLRKISEKS
ncbi:MAG: acyl carrier protein [Actinomycetota bacterium]